jgi:hypothetical protein
MPPEIAQRQRAEKAEAERDEARDELARWRGSHWAAVMRENEDLKQQLAEATEWRPMATAPADGDEQFLVRCEAYGTVSHAITRNPSAYARIGHWLPIPPYHAKKEGQ